MIVWLKSAHVVGLAVWCAGLLALPMLLAARRPGADGPDLWRLQRIARFCFIRLASPAAVLAVGTGIALVFLREVADDTWFGLKLAAVGGLAALHVRAGYVVVGVFRSGGRYSRTQAAVTEFATVAVVGAILWLVLAKSQAFPVAVPDWTSRPGSLQSLVERLIPIP
jgi:protoporphyrinogen IX oxidase